MTSATVASAPASVPASAPAPALGRLPWLNLLGVALAYTVLIGAWFAPVLFGGRILAWDDAVKHYLPSFTVGPVLWSASAGGYPIYVDVQNMAFFPLKLAFQGLGLLGVPLAVAYNLYVLAPLVTAASAAHVYVHAFTRSHAAGAVAGLVFALSSPLLSFVEWPDHAYGAAMLPLMVLALERLRERAGPGRIAWLGVTVALTQLSGYPPMANVLGLIVAVYVLVRGADAPVGRLRFSLAAAAGAALGIAMAAIQLLPTAVAFVPTVATSWTLADFNDLAYAPGDLVRLLFPFITGGGGPLYGDISFGEPTTRLCYLGLAPLLLGAVGLASRRGTRAPQLFWLCAALYVVALSLGDRTPVAHLTFLVPLINRGHEWSRLFVVAAFGVAVCAGCGVSALAGGRAGRRSVLVAVAFLLVVPGVWWLAQSGLTWAHPVMVRARPDTWSFSPLGNPAFGVPFVLTIAAVLTVVVGRTRRWAAVWLVPVLVLVDLTSAGYAHEWRTASPDAADLAHRPASLEPLRTVLAASGQRVVSYTGAGEGDALIAERRHPDDRAGLRQEMGRFWGFETLEYFGKWTNPALGELTDHMDGHRLASGPLPLSVLAVRFVLVHSPRGEAGVAPPSPLARALLAQPDVWRPAGRAGESLVFENTRVMPRAWLAPDARVMDEAAARRVLLSGHLPDGSVFDPSRTVLLPATASSEPGRAPDTAAGTVDVLSRRAGQERFHVRAESPAVLVVSGSWHPSWTVRVNGVPAEVRQADVLLRAVDVPAGESLVDFAFVPRDFYAGAAMSALACLGCAALGALAWRRRRDQTQEPGR